jgi:hypothetical protein
MYGFDSGGSAEVETELNGGHFVILIGLMSKNELVYYVV